MYGWSGLPRSSDCSCIDVDVVGTPMTLRVGTPGRHIVQNVLAVLAAVKLSGADLAKAGLALADLGAVKGRGQRHVLPWHDGEVLLIDESYNANPASIAAALTMLDSAAAEAKGRRIAVLGRHAGTRIGIPHPSRRSCGRCARYLRRAVSGGR